MTVMAARNNQTPEVIAPAQEAVLQTAEITAQALETRVQIPRVTIQESEAETHLEYGIVPTTVGIP